MIAARRLLLLALAVPGPLLAADKVRIPADAPYCAPPNAKPVFVAPMGEAFRADPGKPYPSTLWFVAADANHDGAVSRTEFVADADRFFKKLDLDHDGRLTPEEVVAYERDVAPEIALYGNRSRDYAERASGSPRNGESGYGGAMGAGRYAWLNIPEPVAAADADINRIIDEDEFRGAAGRRFDTLAKGAATLMPAAMPRTPLQVAIEGPCHPRPKPKGKPGQRPGAGGPLGAGDDRDEDRSDDRDDRDRRDEGKQP